MKDKDVIDLVPDNDGTYGLKNVPMKIKQSKKKVEQVSQLKEVNNMGEFFRGIDLGLDFIEGMQKRVKRMTKLKN